MSGAYINLCIKCIATDKKIIDINLIGNNLSSLLRVRNTWLTLSTFCGNGWFWMVFVEIVGKFQMKPFVKKGCKIQCLQDYVPNCSEICFQKRSLLHN